MSSESKAGVYLISILTMIAVGFGLLIARDVLFDSSPHSMDQTAHPSSIREIQRSDRLTTPSVVMPTVGSLMEGDDDVTQDLNKRGLSLYAERKFEAASDLFREALARDPQNHPIRKNLAYAYGGLGWSLINSNRYQSALGHFQKALDLKIEDPTFFMGLGLIYYQLSQEDQAISMLKEAIAHRSEYAEPYKLLGRIYYLRDEMELSVGYYEKALELDPNDRGLEKRLGKARRERVAQSSFQREATRHFTVKFEGHEEHDVAREIINLLEEAYREIGQDLFVFPEAPITVILYSDQQFRDVTLSPSWTKGLFDGKIRLPIEGSQKNPKLLKKVINHEYTHAVVYDISKGNCPTWLNEGIALNLEGSSIDRRKKTLIAHIRQGGRLSALKDLHGSFMALSNREASLAYSQSYWATAFLIDRYGLYRIKDVLVRLSNGEGFEEAFESIFMMSYTQFEKDWLKEVEKKINENT